MSRTSLSRLQNDRHRDRRCKVDAAMHECPIEPNDGCIQSQLAREKSNSGRPSRTWDSIRPRARRGVCDRDEYDRLNRSEYVRNHRRLAGEI